MTDRELAAAAIGILVGFVAGWAWVRGHVGAR